MVLLWQTRAACRLLCSLASSVGETMVLLATALKVCGRARATSGPVVIPAQIVLLLAWAPTRLLFLALESAANRAYWADSKLRRRWAVVD
jgi:hypothetical protein